jgi:hypothetical protein
MRTCTTVSLAAAAALTAAAGAQITLFEATITGDQEVPPVTTMAMGTMTGAYDASLNEFAFAWSLVGPFNGVPSAPGAHIHEAPPGVAGPIVFGFATDTWPLDGAATWTGLTPDNVAALFAGDLYINFHTDQHTGGEIRGQITVVPRPARRD